MKSQDHPKSQSTQTNFSTLSLLEKLRQKDLQIQKLQKELSHFKHRNLSLNEDINKIMNQTPSISGLSMRADPLSRLQKPSNSVNTNFIQKIGAKHPIDTATIEELDFFPKDIRKSIETPDPGIKTFSKLGKKKSNDKNKLPYSKNSKLSLKIKQRLNKNESIISDLVYQDAQDMETWTNLLNKFREDPGLIKQALHINDEKSRNSISVEPVHIRTRVTSAYKTRKSSHDPECRPISAAKTRYRPMTAKVQEIDWSKSILDVQIARGNAEFQPGDQYLSNFQIEEILVNRNLKDSSEIYEKAIKTLEKLKSELLLPKISTSTNKSEEGLEKILSQCVELFRARALVVKILKLIHQREDVMLRLIASEEEDIDSEYDNMENLGKEILQIIAFLKHCKFPIHSFIYLGEDYAFKIQKDNESIISLYPKLKSREAYIGFNL